MDAAGPAISRRSLRVRGLVQGVGFRPFVWRLAHELALEGHVLNDGAGVLIEVQGPANRLAEFSARLRAEAPPLARIDAVESSVQTPDAGGQAFRIDRSGAGAVTTGIVADAAPCTDCLADMFDPANRRWRYAFTNCTNCGPRYTITSALPYDRPNTSMARFAQCPRCLREYEDPADRRFHAQPNACPACGPRLRLLTPDGVAAGVEDPVAATLARLRGGQIVAIKGVGGFHLACDARNGDAVARLRHRKAREQKPFAVMVANAASCAALVLADAAERALLARAERPIVLLAQRAGTDAALPGVAPGMTTLGVMLPSSPLHWLLFHEAAGRPAGSAWMERAQPLVLVMTSANPGGEPLVTGNDEARQRLAGIADCMLVHDRDIVVRCDDSVVRSTGGDASGAAQPAPAFVRRARGWTPAQIRLADDGAAVLATGALLKNTVCLTRGNAAFLSQHIGSLDNAATCEALDEAVAHLASVLRIVPQAVAHDLHPDMYSSLFAARYAARHGLPLIGVQHHHAHVAAVLAEHGHRGPALGLALDGVGLGSDGGAWGGELLAVDGGTFERVAHLRELALPGGDRAAREPWRMAAAALHALGSGEEIAQRFPRYAAAPVAHMLARDLRCPRTSSMGRWFDAAAALLGVCATQSFEGQAPMLLEGLAARHGEADALPGAYCIDSGSDGGELDLLPLLAALTEQNDAALGAAQFHATLVQALAEWTVVHARGRRLDTVAFAGGCFNNRILSDGLRARLRHAGLTVLEAQQAPPNDGGLSLGQAWVARALLARPPSLH